MNSLSKIDTFLYDKYLSSTQTHKKPDRYITHQKIALICVFLAIFGLKIAECGRRVSGVSKIVYMI